MKPSEIISLARRQTGCTEDIVTAEEAYHFLNFVIEDFGAEIRATDSGYGFDVLNVDVNAGQGAYKFESDEEIGAYSNKFPISKIQSVWLMGKDNKWHDLPVHFVDKVDPNQFDAQGEPRACFITRTELNLIPMPKTSTTMQIWGWNYNQELSNQISIEATFAYGPVQYWRNPDADDAGKTYPYAWHHSEGGANRYTSSEKPSVGDEIWELPTGGLDHRPITAIISYDKEENIFIPSRWHYIIVEGLKYWMYGNMGVNFETARNNSRAFYDSEKIKAIQNITDRGQLADTAYFPNLNFLNY